MVKKCIFVFCYLSRVFLQPSHAQCEESIRPENQIILIKNFISQTDAQDLINYYIEQNKILRIGTDNQIAYADIAHAPTRQLIERIAQQVLQVMHASYPLMGKNYRIDHAGIYARIKGNYCSYHADNIYFDCPIHGKDQSLLRKICDGTCPGARFVPNHTHWREYTALIYLNEDFEGGEIAFEDGPFNKLYQKVIPIESHLLVLAPNGPHFYHEVFPIRSGIRYSLHLWYTSR